MPKSAVRIYNYQEWVSEGSMEEFEESWASEMMLACHRALGSHLDPCCLVAALLKTSFGLISAVYMPSGLYTEHC